MVISLSNNGVRETFELQEDQYACVLFIYTKINDLCITITLKKLYGAFLEERGQVYSTTIYTIENVAKEKLSLIF